MDILCNGLVQARYYNPNPTPNPSLFGGAAAVIYYDTSSRPSLYVALTSNTTLVPNQNKNCSMMPSADLIVNLSPPRLNQAVSLDLSPSTYILDPGILAPLRRKASLEIGPKYIRNAPWNRPLLCPIGQSRSITIGFTNACPRRSYQCEYRGKESLEC